MFYWICRSIHLFTTDVGRTVQNMTLIHLINSFLIWIFNHYNKCLLIQYINIVANILYKRLLLTACTIGYVVHDWYWLCKVRGVFVSLKFHWAPGIVEFVLGRFSHFNIAIAYSNSKFCGAWTLIFCEFTSNFSKTRTPLAIPKGNRIHIFMLSTYTFIVLVYIIR